MELLEVLLPVVRAVHARTAIGSIEPDALSAVETPAADVQLTAGLVWQNDGRGTEHIRLDVHRSPCQIEVVDEGEVQFVCASGVVEFTRSELFHESDLVVDAESDEKRDYDARDLLPQA